MKKDAPGADALQGHDDHPKRYFLDTKRGWVPYVAPKSQPAPFAVEHRGELCLVYRVLCDADYFAENPDAQLRFSVNIGNEALNWTLVTRQGGEISGDRYDLIENMRLDKHGTVTERLKRIMLQFATVEIHRVMSDSPDLVTALSEGDPL